MPKPKSREPLFGARFKMTNAEREVAGKLAHLPKEWHESPIRRRKFLQLSEAVSLFAKGMEELASYYPIPRKAIENFKTALQRGEIAIMVEPGNYLEKKGDVVTKGRIVYSPLKEARIIELPESAFDELGNLKPEAVLDLWHELTHAVRSFVPRLERLPTAYDEATTNFIADRLAMLYASKGVNGRFLKLNPNVLVEAREAWRRGLVYKPEVVEGVMERASRKGGLEKEYKEKLLNDFARGELLKDRVRALMHGKHAYLNLLKRANPRLYKIRLVELARKELLDMQLSKRAVEFDNYAMEKALKIVRSNFPVFMGFFRDMQKGDAKFHASINVNKLKGEVKRVLK
ncbi:MAG: hypothetical protein F7B61_03220 [Caldisphaeraceae archaeon]|nr:hypothetical protein [Caldisphaeraceae archaeon]